MNTLLCIGDSNTWGYDPQSPFGGPCPCRWTALLEQALWQVTNLGQNGLCIPRGIRLRELLAWVDTLPHQRFTTLMLGSNDLLCAVAPETAAQELKPLLKELRQRTTPLLIAPPPMVPGAWVDSPALVEASRELSRCYRAVAEELGVPFGDAGEWQVELAFDGVHFTPAGHRAFARGLLGRLEELTEGEQV